MTIGYVLDDTLDRSDGVQQAVIAIGSHMRELGHDVHYIVAETSRTDIEHIHSIGKFVSLPFNGNSVRTPLPARKKTIDELFAEVDFDVLHVQMPFSPFLAARVLKRAPKHVKQVGTFHILPYGRFASYGTKKLSLLIRPSLNRLDSVFAVSAPALEFMEEAFGISGSVLPNPVNYDYFNSFRRQKKEALQIVFIGRFEDRKGVHELVDAYAMLDAKLRKKTELTMCSKGPLFEEIQKKSHGLGLDISFPGFVSEADKAQYLANADIAVFPSMSGESFGIVLAEAMSAGARITIGGNNPGYASVLGDWPETLFDPRDTEAFSAKLEYFLTNKRAAHAIGKKQHAAVKAYDIKVVAQKLLKTAYAD